MGSPIACLNSSTPPTILYISLVGLNKHTHKIQRQKMGLQDMHNVLWLLNRTNLFYFITFSNKMYKSHSLASKLTLATSLGQLGSHQSSHQRSLSPVDPKLQAISNPYPAPILNKFPKKLIHRPTQMSMLTESCWLAPRRGKKFIPEPLGDSVKRQGQRVRSRGRGQFSHLGQQSPSRSFNSRDFEDIGSQKGNKKRRMMHKDHHYDSCAVLASIVENCEETGGRKEAKLVERRHYQGQSQMGRRLEWQDKKVAKEHFKAKYRQKGKNKAKENMGSTYSSIHLKYALK